MSPQPDRSGTESTASPARNFTLSIEDRLRAFAAGPKAYMRRRRRIEDLHEEIVRDLADGRVFDSQRIPQHVLRKLEALNELIERHNKYFPIEANLPFDPKTGQMLELGRPWEPMRPIEIDVLIQIAQPSHPSG